MPLPRTFPRTFLPLLLILGATPASLVPAATTRATTTRSSDLPQPTRITLKLDGVPADEALRQLFERADLRTEQLFPPHLAGELKAIPVTADFSGDAFMAALLQICRQADLEPQFPFAPGRPISFSLRRSRGDAGPPDSATARTTTRTTTPATPATPATTRATTSMRPSSAPAARAALPPLRPSWVDAPAMLGGPLFFVATGATRTRGVNFEAAGQVDADLRINLMVLRDPKMRLFAIANHGIVDEAIDEAGRSLRLADPVPQSDHPQTEARPAHESERLLFAVTIPLAYTEQSRTLKLLRGRLNTSIITRSEPLEIIAKGASTADQKQAGKFRITVGKLEPAGDGARLALTIHDYPPGGDTWNEARALLGRSGFRVVEPPGAAYWIDVNLHGVQEGRIESSVHFRPIARPGAAPPPRVPTRVVWDAPVEVSEFALPIEFQDLPLPARQ